MSTILKALKKLEQEKQDQRHALPGHILLGSGASGPGRNGPPGWSRRKWIRRILATVLIVFLGTTTIYFYWQSRFKPEGGPTAVVDPPPRSATVAKQDSPATDRPVAQQPTSAGYQPAQGASESERAPNAGGSLRSPAVANGTAQGTPQSTPKAQTASVQAKTAEEGTEPPGAPSKPVIARTAKAPEPERNPAPRPVRPPQNKPSATQRQDPPPPATKSKPLVAPPSSEARSPYPDAPPLTDGRLKVQALAWSPTAEDRMAVINTRIVREGDRVDGFTVLSIQHDDVFVQEKGVVYRVAFGRP